MSIHSISLLTGLAAAPISEARGAIIYGLGTGMSPWLVLSVSLAVNIAIIPVVFQLLRIGRLRTLAFKIFGKKAENIIEKNKPKFEKWGLLALIPFTAVPLPLTGVWTSIFISEILGFNRRKATLAISAGAVVAAIIVFVSAQGLLNIMA